ncbi:MAG: oxygenase MpaB family protein [Burkholderiales bacterium]
MLEAALRSLIRRSVGHRGPPLAFLEPPGDPGLFGPDSAIWEIHADFVSMMVGGMRALMLQALHPRALAGVWDHSDFRRDLSGRLSRTAYFIAATTYGSQSMAESAIRRVRAIHAEVQGVDEDGRPYRADEPELLEWVHLTEAWSFLTSYQRFAQPDLPQETQDRYFAEMANLSQRLGATALPETRAGVEQRMADRLPQLVYGPRARTAIGLLRDIPVEPEKKPLMRLLHAAAEVELPLWARDLMGLPAPGFLRREAIVSGVSLLAIPIRAALNDGVAAHARRRVANRPT